MTTEHKQVVVLGAGVIGLTTGISIIEKSSSRLEYAVTVFASHLPTDPKSIDYTSHWAGAHHVSHATGAGHSAPDANSSSNASEHPDQLSIDKETFRIMWDLSAPDSEAEHCFMRLKQVEYYQEEIPEGKAHHLSWYPDFHVLPSAAMTPELKSQGIRSGVSFTTFTIDTPAYLRYLFSRFEKAGGKVVRGRLEHVRDVETQIGAQIDAILNCTGLGALTLGGVEDSNVYPLRGQTVLLRAPWVKFGRTVSNKEGLWTYIIPRRSGDLILGGIKEPNDYHPTPRPETTLDILTRGLNFCPELIPHSEADSQETALERIKSIILEEGCGLRPARHGGIRLETELVDINVAFDSTESKTKPVPLIHNYGHSGSGFQSSWGSAHRAVKLLHGVLE
ncbi:hypothetical protein BDP27DRAFT_666457 [Rhodocollybia butyracea]|uniref:FAD dependent oxidoreductase domain-containing protein n=1 Tax=Rhodocollybia butyracea TaxID=206335 RepID=A0A9P5PV32_9AGAR|nr:hypothetical protein BDP27DRAFT_666457 [Rhodocollybia butyracea]